MKLDQFDYEKYIQGRIVVTRDGLPVTELVKFNQNVDQPIYGVVKDRGGIHTWSMQGKYNVAYHEDDDNDLFLLPEGVLSFRELDEKRMNAIAFSLFMGASGFKKSSLGWFDPNEKTHKYFTYNEMYDIFETITK